MRIMFVMVRVAPEFVDEALNALAGSGFDATRDDELGDSQGVVLKTSTMFPVEGNLPIGLQVEHIAEVGAALEAAGVPFVQAGNGQSIQSPFVSRFTVKRGMADGRDLNFLAESWEEFDARFLATFGRPRTALDAVEVEGLAANDK